MPAASVADELQRDDRAYYEAERAGGESLRFWIPDRVVVVLGRGNNADREVKSTNCAADGVSVLRRSTGGGAVVLMPGCLCFAVIFDLEQRPELFSATATNHWVMGRLATALSRHSGESVAVDGQSDLVIAGRKIGGSAQRRGRRAVLFHGSLLLDAEPDLMGKYLHEPVRRPAYRGERRHHEFVRNAGWPVSLAEKAVKECLFVGEHLDFNIGNSHISRLFCD